MIRCYLNRSEYSCYIIDWTPLILQNVQANASIGINWRWYQKPNEGGKKTKDMKTLCQWKLQKALKLIKNERKHKVFVICKGHILGGCELTVRVKHSRHKANCWWLIWIILCELKRKFKRTWSTQNMVICHTVHKKFTNKYTSENYQNQIKN